MITPRTVDFRTRSVGYAEFIDPVQFVDDLAPVRVQSNGAAAGRGLVRAGLPSLTLQVDRRALTFTTDDQGRLVVEPRRSGHLVVDLEPEAFSDLVQDVASTFGLQMAGRASVRHGSADDFLAWEPILRCLLDGRPLYAGGDVELCDQGGAPLDLDRSFALDDDPDEIGHFLAEAGYLHLRAVFSEEEMAAVSADLDDAMLAAAPDDGASWWARTEAGEQYPARILGFNTWSSPLRELLHSARFQRIGTFTEDRFVQRDPEVGDSAEGLLKKIGVVEGMSDVSWHKDCALGGHSRGCCGLTVGISVTGAGRENGELGVMAGSHRANLPLLGVEGVDLPRVPLPTRTGDVTVHCSCTFHMSRPPVSAERKVVYTGFGLAPRAGDRPLEVDPAEARRARAELGGRDRRLPEITRSSSFEL
ncbi:MAG TPA: phytanoyl-CoA dioxygenase family protein [Acidimicrobiales bacterium]